MLDFLVSNSPEAAALRRRFVFKVVPMLNPDGVVEGNHRTGLSGVDLNRTYDRPCPRRHPPIFWTKKLVKALSRQRRLFLYCDFHGHSRIKNICIYGCDETLADPSLRPRLPLPPSIAQAKDGPLADPSSPLSSPASPAPAPALAPASSPSSSPPSPVPTAKGAGGVAFTLDLGLGPSAAPRKRNLRAKAKAKAKVKRQDEAPAPAESGGESASGSDKLSDLPDERLFCALLEKRASRLFRYDDCRFSVRKDKATCARVVFWRELGIRRVFTMESSYCGASFGPLEGVHFTPEHLAEMGTAFCLALLDMSDLEQTAIKAREGNGNGVGAGVGTGSIKAGPPSKL